MQQRPVMAGHAEFNESSEPAAKQPNVHVKQQLSNQTPPTPPSAVDAGMIGILTTTSTLGGSYAAVTPPKQQQHQSAGHIAVASGEPLTHQHDDPSPTSQQPVRKQKGALGNAVLRWHEDLPAVAASAAAAPAGPALLASSAAVTALPPATAESAPPSPVPAAVLNDCPAARALPPPPPNAVPQETAAAAAAAMSAASPGHSEHRYSTEFIKFGKKKLLPVLLAEGGVVAILEHGDACLQLIQQLQDCHWLQVVYITYEGARSLGMDDYKVGKKDFFRGVHIVFNYGGQHLPAEQWEQRMQGCQDPGKLSSYGGFGEGSTLGQVNLSKEYIRIESNYRYDGRRWWQRGVASLLEELWIVSPGDNEATGAKNRPRRIAVTQEQLPDFRRAVFHITVLLLLQWHAQDKQQHPVLQEFADAQQRRVLSAQLASTTQTGSSHHV